MGPVEGTAKQEWKDGGSVVFASFVGFSYLGLMTYSLSLFIDPLTREFGWSRTFISSGFSISTFASALLAPLLGMALDRWGVRRIALPGIAISGFAIAAFATITGAVWQWYMLWILYSIFTVATKQTLWATAVTSVFSKGRGLALGVAMCGGALTQVAVPPLTVWLIDDFGWRMAYVALGLGWGAATLLVSWLFLRNRPGSAVPVPKPTDDTAPAPVATAEPAGLTLAEAFRDRGLWSIAISTFLIMALTIGFSIHQMPILEEAGVSRGYAALLASTVGFAGIAGKLLTGVLVDRFRANWVGGLTLAVTAVSFALLIEGVRSPTLIVAAMLVNGYTQGAKVQITSYLTARYAGVKSFGTIFGFMSAVMTFSSGVGPLLAGFIYDTAGNYTPFLIAGAIGSVIAGVLLLALPAYPVWANERAPAKPALA